MFSTLSLANTRAGLPPVPTEDLSADIRKAIAADRSHKIVVLDDDPTGTQTVYDVPVLTTWDTKALRDEFANTSPCFYILTNSRSVPPAAAHRLNLEVAGNLCTAAGDRPFTVISRSDSTLRGHFPSETNALDEALGPFDATMVMPYFEAGGRYTIDDVHYVAEGDDLVPAAATPFARDASFGYTSSNLRQWVEEKTAGRVRAADIQSISISELRRSGADATRLLCNRLCSMPPGCYCIVNACHPKDAECFAAGAYLAERGGARFLYRTAAQFVAARLGLEPRPLLSVTDFAAGSAQGGLVVVGSHVPQTTAQLAHLFDHGELARVELPVSMVIQPASCDGIVCGVVTEIDGHLRAGRDVVLFTSREVVAGCDASESLQISAQVSSAVVNVVAALQVQPRFIVAKGGITSSDVATKGLGVRRAMVRGQIFPGVPVWRLGAESRFPGLDYVVFPGNVGGPDALAEVCRKLNSSCYS